LGQAAIVFQSAPKSTYLPARDQFFFSLPVITFGSNNVMSYYTRLFCISTEVPAAADAVAFANSKSNQYKMAIDEATMDVFSNGSMAFEMKYKDGLPPIIVEINMVDDIDPVAKEEIKEFIADIGFAGFSSAKRKVINHLERTSFIVACEHSHGIDEDGENAIRNFIQFFIDHCNGLFHADGEGFYNEDMTLLLADK